MKDTFFVGPSHSSLRSGKMIAEGSVHLDGRKYVLDHSVYDGLEMIASASSICTTARDMYRWLLFLSNDGKVSSRNIQLIQKETLEMIYEGILPRGRDGNPTIEGYRNPDIHTSYTRTMNSLGFINGNYDGNEFVSQDGSLPGYQTLATYIPDKKTGIYVAMLGDESPKTFAAKVLMNIAGLDIMLRGDSWITRPSVCSTLDKLVNLHNKPMSSEEPWPVSKRPNSRPMEDYAQTYRNYAFGDVVVKFNTTENEDGLLLEYGKVQYRLAPTDKNDTFHVSTMYKRKRIWKEGGEM
ncbi:protein flp-like [Elysia marginata]|uniref:Protein flp-like n=1 Tax=Elysia marginata TaxID=1093978 RepID=A0AAV4JPF6_9GAST|nr:protein flp-like [Elysia marginata]